MKGSPNECPGGYPAESNTDCLADTDHIHNHEDYEYAQQSAREDEEVLGFEPFEFCRAADPFVN